MVQLQRVLAVIYRQQLPNQCYVSIGRRLAEAPLGVSATLVTDGEVEAKASPHVPRNLEGLWGMVGGETKEDHRLVWLSPYGVEWMVSRILLTYQAHQQVATGTQGGGRA